MSAPSTREHLRAPGSLAGEIIGLLHEPFLVLDAERRVAAASEPFYLHFGLRTDQVLGRRLYDLGEGEWGAPAVRSLLEEIGPARAVVEDHPLPVASRAAPGEQVLCTLRPVRSGANEIELYLLSFRSVPLPQPAPPASLARIANEHVTDVVTLYRRDGSCLYAGAAVREALGYAPEEWRRFRACDVVHPSDRQALLDRLSAEGRLDVPWRLTLRVRRQSGDYLWMDTTVRLGQDEELGEVVHTSARDVSERKRAEEAVHWLSRHVKLILDSAAEGIFGVDTQGVITFINPAAARTLGYPVSDLVGHPYRTLLPDDAPAEDEISAVLRDGVARRTGDAAFVRRDGSRFTAEYACNPARQRGALVGGVVTFRDVTERMRAEADLRRSEWLAGVGQTALAVRHEINNPLTSLLAEASMLEIGGNTPEEERDMIASIAGQARRIRDVVRRLTERQDDPPVRHDGAQAMLDLTE